MPRIPRSSAGNVCYHITNRTPLDEPAFRDEADFDHFVNLIVAANERVKLGVFGYCVMPESFNLLVKPRRAGDLSRWMQWLMTSHGHRHRHIYGTAGPIWEDRYKAFPVQQGGALVTMLRYVEAGPVEAEYVDQAQDWQWSSLYLRTQRKVGELTDAEQTLKPMVASLPVKLPAGWARLVNTPMDDAEYDAVETCIDRNRPFGTDSWTRSTAKRLGLESTLRSRGRPPKSADKQ